MVDPRAGGDFRGDLLDGIGPQLRADAEDHGADVGADDRIVGRHRVATALGLKPSLVADDPGDVGELMADDGVGWEIHGRAGVAADFASAMPAPVTLLQVAATKSNRPFAPFIRGAAREDRKILQHPSNCRPKHGAATVGPLAGYSLDPLRRAHSDRRMQNLPRFGMWLGLGCAWLALGNVVATRATTEPAPVAFPGAVGFGIETPGGRGGRVLKVTNLHAAGPGSLAAAVSAKGPRIVVFEVGGVIDLDATTLSIAEPFLTLAGQTAPSPGITLIRGGVTIRTHDVVIQHLRVRTGDVGRSKKSGWEVDSMSTTAAWNVVIDHCSLAWGTDENLSASGPRFAGGETAEAWRAHTSHDVTFSHCIIAEGLSQSSHQKGEHSKGGLIHDNVRRIAIIGNLYASNVERNPLFKGGVQGVVVNNLIDNPGRKAVHYNLWGSEWAGHPFVAGELAVVGNVLHYGPDTQPGRPLVAVDGHGVLELFAEDNLAFDRQGQPVAEIAVMLSRGPREQRQGAGAKDGADPDYAVRPADVQVAEVKRLPTAPVWPKNFRAQPAAEVKAAVLKNAGARPWDRDAVDARIVSQVRAGQGRIIDSQEQVGGYPRAAMTVRKLTVPAEGLDAWLASFTPPSDE